ncbi:1698_t:CDS:2, partial [Entrophospora sp. SA101]
EDDFRSKIELFSSDQSPEYETVDILPKPGMVLKTLVKTSMETNKYPSNMKFFINMCYSDKIPKPTCTSEEELRKAMNGDADAIYRVPNVLNDIKFDKDAVMMCKSTEEMSCMRFYCEQRGVSKNSKRL